MAVQKDVGFCGSSKIKKILVLSLGLAAGGAWIGTWIGSQNAGAAMPAIADSRAADDMQKAKDAVENAEQYLNLQDNEKSLFRDEVLTQSSFFVVPAPQGGGSGFRVDEPQLRHYLSFSAKNLMSSQEEGRQVKTLCYRIESAVGCEACANLAQGLLKFLPKRLNRRGFVAREIPTSALPQSVGPEPLVLSVEKLNEAATQIGCNQKFLAVINPGGSGDPKTDSFMEVKDQGKAVYQARSSVTVEKDLLLAAAPTTKKPAPPGPGPVVTTLVKTTASLFSTLGERLASLALSRQGPTKRLILEKIPSYSAYILLKKKLVDSIEGLTSLDERTMAPRSIEFIVQGSVTLDELNKKLVDAIGADPVIESHQVEDDVLKVVLK